MTTIIQKSLIISLTKPVPEKIQGRMRQKGDVTAKVKQISEILRNNPKLKEDVEIMGRVLALTEKSRDRDVQKFREKLIFDFCCKEENGIVKITFRDFIPDREKEWVVHSCSPDKGRFDVKKGTLTFLEGALKKLDKDQLWDFIQKQGVKELVIHHKEGKPIVYKERILQQLIEKKPSVDALTETYLLKFSGGKELVETTAKLLLCGDYFECALKHGMKETQTKVIDFTGSNVSFNGFYGILQTVKTGKKDSTVLDDLYEVACEYLQFFKELPEGTFGPAEYEYYYGIKVDNVPLVPKEFIEFLKGPCPIFKDKQASDTHMLVLMVEGLDLNTWEERTKNHFNGQETENGFDYIYSDIKAKHGEEKVEKPYWYLKTKRLLPNSQGYDKTRADQLAIAKKYGYEAPSILEEAVGVLTWYVRTGERLMTRDEDGYWIFTICRNEPVCKDSNLFVGGFGPAGLRVCPDYDDCRVGVAGVRRK